MNKIDYLFAGYVAGVFMTVALFMVTGGSK